MKIPKEFQRRVFASRAEASAAGSGGLSGILNVTGVMDSWRSVIFPGAHAPHCEAFVRDGKMLYGHKWSDPEIGIVLSAAEVIEDVAGARRSVLRWETEYHDDEVAQRMRGIVNKRLSRKKTVDLSVGFWPDWSECLDFKNGQQLWDYAVGKGCDMSLFDPAIRTDEGWCWAIPKLKALAEGSIVNDGATPGSEATDARSYLNDLSSGTLGLTLGDHLDTGLVTLQGLTSRLLTARERRVAEGEDLAADRLPQVESLLEALGGLRDALSAHVRQPAEADALNRRLDELVLAERFQRLSA